MTNERDSAQVALESILLLISAWNLCPVPGTDISCSMVAVGRECSFPIVCKHAKLYLVPGSVKLYTQELTRHLSSCCEIAVLLVKGKHCWHGELVNS